MTEFALAVNLGSAAYSLSVVPAFAILTSVPREEPTPIKDENLSETEVKRREVLAKHSWNTFNRDIWFFTGTIVVYWLLLIDKQADLVDCGILFLITAFYVFVIMYQG
mmetsp:Transcript_5673/g.5174  ORF Transcript_5673/g.5174 Transcript_5673/m.5174 type:complete len:108 (+) Transcript_5673:289-612(+)